MAAAGPEAPANQLNAESARGAQTEAIAAAANAAAIAQGGAAGARRDGAPEAATAGTDRPPERVASHKWLVAVAVMIGTILEVLDSSIVNVSLPHMQGTFSAGVDEIAWVLTSYLVANGIMIPMTGWISARFGRKRYFMFSVTTFVIASAFCGAAGSLGEMVIFRLVQGAAGAAMLPSSQAILMETFPPEEQQMAMAVWGMGLMVAPILGPTLGGWITDNWNWRWNFYINLPLGAIALAMVSAFVHDPSYLRQRFKGSRIDYPGMIFLALWLALLQIVLDRGQRSDWFDAPWVRIATAASIVSMVALIYREWHISEPVVELHFLKIRQFAAAIFAVVVLSFILFGTGLLNPIFLQEYLGYTATTAGLVMWPRALAAMASMMFAGQVARAGFDNKRLIGVAFTLMALGLWAMARWNLDVGIWQVIWPGMVLGLGLGMCFPVLSAAALSCIPRERMGYAASLYNMMRNTGAAVGIAYLTNMLLHNQQIHQSYLVQHMSVFDAWRMSNVAPQSPGAPGFHFMPELVTGQKQGLGMVYGMLRQQSAMLAFNDIYRMLTGFALLMIPSFLLFRGAKLSSGASPAAH